MTLISGEVVSYLEMCREEKASLQPGAPYADAVVDEGKALIYEGHDVPKTPGVPSRRRSTSEVR